MFFWNGGKFNQDLMIESLNLYEAKKVFDIIAEGIFVQMALVKLRCDAFFYPVFHLMLGCIYIHCSMTLIFLKRMFCFIESGQALIQL
jgi:hypothetical protein